MVKRAEIPQHESFDLLYYYQCYGCDKLSSAFGIYTDLSALTDKCICPYIPYILTYECMVGCAWFFDSKCFDHHHKSYT